MISILISTLHQTVPWPFPVTACLLSFKDDDRLKCRNHGAVCNVMGGLELQSRRRDDGRDPERATHEPIAANDIERGECTESDRYRGNELAHFVHNIA
jgi:hypothetical protein